MHVCRNRQPSAVDVVDAVIVDGLESFAVAVVRVIQSVGMLQMRSWKARRCNDALCVITYRCRALELRYKELLVSEHLEATTNHLNHPATFQIGKSQFENNQSAGLWFEGWIDTRTSREPTRLLL